MIQQSTQEATMAKTDIIRDIIRELLHEKPGITHGQIMEHTGLAGKTVTKHIRAIREEWQRKE